MGLHREDVLGVEVIAAQQMAGPGGVESVVVRVAPGVVGHH